MRISVIREVKAPIGINIFFQEMILLLDDDWLLDGNGPAIDSDFRLSTLELEVGCLVSNKFIIGGFEGENVGIFEGKKVGGAEEDDGSRDG